MTDLCKMLFEQAKKCQTTTGCGLLLAIKGHLEGRQVYDGCDELWQVADTILNVGAAEVNSNVEKLLNHLAEARGLAESLSYTPGGGTQ